MQTIHMRILLWFLLLSRLSIDKVSFCFCIWVSIDFNECGREDCGFREVSIACMIFQQVKNCVVIYGQFPVTRWSFKTSLESEISSSLSPSITHMRDRLISILAKVKSMCLFYWFHYARTRDWCDFIRNSDVILVGEILGLENSIALIPLSNINLCAIQFASDYYGNLQLNFHLSTVWR